jgi:hypothetical protein
MAQVFVTYIVRMQLRHCMGMINKWKPTIFTSDNTIHGAEWDISFVVYICTRIGLFSPMKFM